MTTRAQFPLSNKALRMGLSSALAIGLLAGCTASGPHASKFAAGAEAAVGSERGVALAEKAVLADPRNPAYRTLLGNAYLRSGRFESARQAYDEAMQLGEDSGKAALSLALADIALGQRDSAIDTLVAYRAALPSADYGLALALAGRAPEGVSVLIGALRSGENTPKTRQNLAYAYALAELWRDARVMASQDVPADQLDGRMQEWLLNSNPRDSRTRVAGLLGAPVRADAGQPQALALANFPDTQGVRRADAAPAAPVAADAAPMLAQAAVQELPALPVAEPAPVVADASRAPAGLLLAVDALPARVRVRNVPAPVRAVATGGSHLVQLGAFASEQGAQRAWRHYAKVNPALAGHKSLIVRTTVNGRTLWRVQAAGFEGFARAGTMCGQIKARGGACLVMAAPVRSVPGHVAETRFARRR